MLYFEFVYYLNLISLKKMRYNRVFDQAYNRVGTSVPKDRFAAIINPNALGMESREEFYAPMRFNIQVTPSRTRGVITLDVPVHGNADWYQTMQESIAGMLGGNTEHADVIRFKTVTGEDLADIPKDKMTCVGTLNMFVNGKLRRFKSVDPRNVPIEYSVTKGSDLKHWYKEVSQTLPEAIACEMNKCGKPHELDDMISEGGIVQRAIENHLIKAAFPQEWSEFVRSHHVRSPKSLQENVAEAVLQDVSSAVLGFIRAHVGASSDQIRAHLNTVSSRKEDGTRLNAPILTAVSSSFPAAGGENGMDMYRRLVDGAVITPALEQNVIRIIHTDSPALKKQRRIAQAHAVGEDKATLQVATSTADHHPWNAHIHHMLYPIKGAYPSDYLARHVHQDMRESAYYPGEPIKAYQAYHLFRGYHGAPPGVAMKAGRPVEGLVPIEKCSKPKRGGKKKKKRGSKEKEPTRMMYTPLRENVGTDIMEWQHSKMVPIKEGIPEIVPIEAHCHRKDQKGEKYYDERFMETECPQVIPIASKVEIPEIVPIETHCRRKKDKRKSKKYYDERSMETECPQVIPIASKAEKKEDEFAHLPQVEDIFKD